METLTVPPRAVDGADMGPLSHQVNLTPPRAVDGADMGPLSQQVYLIPPRAEAASSSPLSLSVKSIVILGDLYTMEDRLTSIIKDGELVPRPPHIFASKVLNLSTADMSFSNVFVQGLPVLWGRAAPDFTVLHLGSFEMARGKLKSKGAHSQMVKSFCKELILRARAELSDSERVNLVAKLATHKFILCNLPDFGEYDDPELAEIIRWDGYRALRGDDTKDKGNRFKGLYDNNLITCFTGNKFFQNNYLGSVNVKGFNVPLLDMRSQDAFNEKIYYVLVRHICERCAILSYNSEEYLNVYSRGCGVSS